jgi:Flp pilus assembly pilin Flp
MRKLLREFWRDERGYVPMMEWALVASILTLGTFATLLAMRTP